MIQTQNPNQMQDATISEALWRFSSVKDDELTGYIKPAYETEPNQIFYAAAMRAVSNRYLAADYAAGELPSQQDALTASGDFAYLHHLGTTEQKEIKIAHLRSGCDCIQENPQCYMQFHLRGIKGTNKELLFASTMSAARADGAPVIAVPSSAFSDIYGGADAHDFVYYNTINEGRPLATRVQITSDRSDAKSAKYNPAIAVVHVGDMFGVRARDLVNLLATKTPTIQDVRGAATYAAAAERVFIPHRQRATRMRMGSMGVRVLQNAA